MPVIEVNGVAYAHPGGSELFAVDGALPNSCASVEVEISPRTRTSPVVVAASHEPLSLNPLALLSGRSVAGWPSGSAIDSEDTLRFSVLAGVRPRVEVFPLERAEETFARVMSNKVRFRAVLVP